MTRPTPADAEPVATAVHRDGRIAVVGGGPAGLIAAQELARCGGRVVLLDASPSVGRKFLLAGRGGLNLTHSEPLGALIDRYGDAAPRLRAALEGFTPTDLRAWCLDLGEPTFVGSSGRVFPESFRANRLLDSWPGSWQAIAPIFTIEEVIREAHELANAAVVEDAAMDAPPADKMMRKAKAKRRG